VIFVMCWEIYVLSEVERGQKRKKLNGQHMFDRPDNSCLDDDRSFIAAGPRLWNSLPVPLHLRKPNLIGQLTGTISASMS